MTIVLIAVFFVKTEIIFLIKVIFTKIDAAVVFKLNMNMTLLHLVCTILILSNNERKEYHPSIILKKNNK